MRKLPFYTILAALLLLFTTAPAFADASMNLSGPAGGSTVQVNINLSTNGESDNAVDVTVSYSGTATINSISCGNVFSISTQHSISGSTAEIQCGVPNGFTGTTTVASFNASLNGNVTFSISSASVYRNDGRGTFYTITNTGNSYTANSSQPTATPTATPSPTASTSSSTTPTVKTTTTTSASPTQKKTVTTATTTPTVNVTAANGGSPGSFSAHPTTQTKVTQANQPSLVVITQPKANSTPTPVTEEGNTIVITPSTAASIPTLIQGYFNNTVSTLLFVVPILLLLLMVAFMSLKIYQMNRRRQREIELLFEHEFGELSALESKMDLLNEKSGKGKDNFKAEFERTRDQILKEIRPDFIGKEGAKVEAATK